MRIINGLVLVSAALLALPLRGQDVFRSSTRLGESTQPDTSRTAPSFSVTHLDKSGPALYGPISAPASGSSSGLATSLSVAPLPYPAQDSLNFLRYVDSLASRRIEVVHRKEAASKLVLSERENYLNQLRDVPSILPFYVAPDKATGLSRTRMSSGFGMRQHPISGNLVSHAGIDLPAPMGTLVYATADGYCRQIVNQPEGIGLAIYLSHGRGHQTLYGHLLISRIKPGEFVVRGQAIGLVGASGLTTGSHLHYGVRYNGEVVDPLPYCFLLSRPTSSPPA